MIIKNHNGATAVEFALILPVLLLIVFGITEFSLVLFNKHIITNASREGARAGIVARPNRFVQDADVVNVEAVVKSWAEAHLVTFGGTDEVRVKIDIFDCIDEDADCKAVYDLDDPLTGDIYELYDVGHAWKNPCRDFECPLKVTVEYDYEFLVLPFFGFRPITLYARSLMRME
jgi:hypothetical protein